MNYFRSNIGLADKKLEAKEYEENLDNWVYDKETGCWDERYPQ